MLPGKPRRSRYGERVRAGRKLLMVVGGVIAVLLVVGGLLAAKRPPRPDLPLPAAQKLSDVRGNCRSGNELLSCSTQGPRSFLTVRAGGDPRSSSQALFTAMEQAGWTKDAKGRTARDYAHGGAPEDLQPVYCKDGDGCIGLFRYEPAGYVLAWFS